MGQNRSHVVENNFTGEVEGMRLPEERRNNEELTKKNSENLYARIENLEKRQCTLEQRVQVQDAVSRTFLTYEQGLEFASRITSHLESMEGRIREQLIAPLGISKNEGGEPHIFKGPRGKCDNCNKELSKNYIAVHKKLYCHPPNPQTGGPQQTGCVVRQ